MFENLKITTYPICGIISDAHLPIDGILYYQAYRDAYGPEDLSYPGETSSGIGEVYMPLRRLNEAYDGFRYADGAPLWAGVPQPDLAQRSEAWYYAASFAQWSAPVVEGVDYWNKRFDQSLSDLVDFGNRRGKVIIEQGEYKAYHMPVWYRHALSVSWYVVGDGAEIERLLSCVTHIGKKGSQGWGHVRGWTVAPWHADWSVWGESGQLMRAIPDAGGILTGIRPSYWARRNQLRCRLPEGDR